MEIKYPVYRFQATVAGRKKVRMVVYFLSQSSCYCVNPCNIVVTLIGFQHLYGLVYCPFKTDCVKQMHYVGLIKLPEVRSFDSQFNVFIIIKLIVLHA